MDFTQLYSPAQLAAFQLVREALIADPKALDNRTGAAPSVNALEDTGDGQAQ